MVLTSMFTALRFAEVPVAPGADEARRWAQDELAQKVYQDAKPGWAEQLWTLIKQAFAELLGKIGVAPGQTGLVITIIIVLLALVVVVLIVRPTLNRRKRQTDEVFADSPLLSADEHRTRAQGAAAAGDFLTAVSEQFRAMVRAAEERDVSIPAPGRTALEITAELERAFPDQHVALHRSADIFNAVRYGQTPPTVEMYQELADTDRTVAAAAPIYQDHFGVSQPLEPRS